MCSRHTAGQPRVSMRMSERQASTQRSSKVDLGRNRYQRSNDGYSGVRSSQASPETHDSERSSRFDQNLYTGSMPAPAMRSAVDGTDSGSKFAGLIASSCSSPSMGAHVHTSASKIA